MRLSIDLEGRFTGYKCQLTFFDIVTIRKEKRQPCLFSFKIMTVTKRRRPTFDVSFWFLVTG